MSPEQHSQRIQQEMISAGVTQLGLKRFASHYLPRVIREDEHIGAIVHGRYREGAGLLSLAEGMLVATDNHIIFLDHKPGFTSSDEISYNVVSGVQATTAGPFTAVTLHTKIANYTLRYVNAGQAKRFVNYIEQRILDVPRGAVAPLPKTATPLPLKLDAQTIAFLKSHETGVVSSVDRGGNAYGAVVYYAVDDNTIYFLTKTSTRKAQNIPGHGQVALTVYDEKLAQTVQLSAMGEIEADQQVRERVFQAIMKLRNYGGEQQLPPVATIHDGSYEVFKLVPHAARFVDFLARHHGGQASSE